MPLWKKTGMPSLNSRKLIAKIADKWPAKVLSVAAALILFMFHRMSTLETRFFSTPLRVENGSELVPASVYTHVVRVNLRGDAGSIYTILDSDIEAYIDLTSYISEGWHQVPVQIRKKGSALGAEPLEITTDPLELNLRLEYGISRNIPLQPVFRGTAASGFEMVAHFLNPSRVVAVGPRSIMEAITYFPTGIIDLEGRDEDFAIMVNIENNDPLIVIQGNGMTEFRGAVRRPMQPYGDEQP